MYMDAGDPGENIIFFAGGVHSADVCIYTANIKHSIKMRPRVHYEANIGTESGATLIMLIVDQKSFFH